MKPSFLVLALAVAGCSANSTVPAAGPEEEAEPVAREFIRVAVERRDLARAWKLAHPALRRGFTYREWLTGDIPVPPFPRRAVAAVSFKVEHAFRREVWFDVYVMTRASSGIKSQSFWMFLGRRRLNAPWRVRSFLPAASPGTVP